MPLESKGAAVTIFCADGYNYERKSDHEPHQVPDHGYNCLEAQEVASKDGIRSPEPKHTGKRSESRVRGSQSGLAVLAEKSAGATAASAEVLRRARTDGSAPPGRDSPDAGNTEEENIFSDANC